MEDGGWVTAWSYAQRRTSFTRWENQESFTVKITNNISGHGVKLKFSNWYGSRRARIKSVSIALGRQEYGIFVGGRREFYVSPQEDIYSDPIALPITTCIVRIHVTFLDSRRPESGNTFQNGIAMVLQSFLVAADSKADVVAFFGDSITHRQKWTEPLTELWHKERPGGLAAFEVSIDGSRLLNGSPAKEDETLGFVAAKRFGHDVLGNAGINYVVFALGLNDLSIEETGEQVLSLETYQQATRFIVGEAHRKGIRIAGLTITPRRADGCYTSRKNYLRKEINCWIMQDAPFDLAVDVAAVVEDSTGTALREGYQEPDGVHINRAAGKAIAGAIAEAWNIW